MILSPEISHNLGQFQDAIERYRDLTGKAGDDVLEQKGRDLSIKLYQEFSRHKWKQGKRAGSVLKAMFATATRLPRSAYRQGNRLTNPDGGQVPVRYPGPGPSAKTSIPATTASGANMGAWRTAVAAEIARRKAGVGVLGASFLWYRRRSNASFGTYFVRNSTGKPLGAVEKGDGYLRIVGYTEGLDVVDGNYGIVAQAIANSTDDTNQWLQKKFRDVWDQSFEPLRRAAA